MTDEEEKTDPSANVPLWIERAVENAMGRALKAIDDGCAAREARMAAVDKAAAEREAAREARVIAALDKLGVARLELNQKANEAGLRSLREDVEKLRSDVDSLLDWRRDAQRCPPPSEGADAE
jgi:hypothetical protein